MRIPAPPTPTRWALRTPSRRGHRHRRYRPRRRRTRDRPITAAHLRDQRGESAAASGSGPRAQRPRPSRPASRIVDRTSSGCQPARTSRREGRVLEQVGRADRGPAPARSPPDGSRSRGDTERGSPGRRRSASSVMLFAPARDTARSATRVREVHPFDERQRPDPQRPLGAPRRGRSTSRWVGARAHEQLEVGALRQMLGGARHRSVQVQCPLAPAERPARSCGKGPGRRPPSPRTPAPPRAAGTLGSPRGPGCPSPRAGGAAAGRPRPRTSGRPRRPSVRGTGSRGPGTPFCSSSTTGAPCAPSREHGRSAHVAADADHDVAPSAIRAASPDDARRDRTERADGRARHPVCADVTADAWNG